MTTQSFDLSTLDGNNGFIINGENQEELGFSVSDAGDINGDGIADLVISAPSSDLNNKGNAGKTYVVFGSSNGFDSNLDLATLDGTKGFVINGAEEGDQSGYSISSLGDINGDGVDDLAIGSPGDIGDNLGKVHVIFGSKEADYFNNPIDLSDLGNKGFTIQGSQFSRNAGWAVSSAGDINGDGIKDLLIGATNDGNNGPGIVGKSYVIFGQENFNSTIDLDNDNEFGVNDGLIIISDEDNNLGFSVSAAGDINGDGIDDLIIGAPYADPNGSNSGSTFVIYGRDKDNPFTNKFTDGNINISELDIEDGFAINGQGVEQSGFSVSKAGDINGDGIGDLIIGARDGGTNYTGKAYVVFGKDGKFESNINLADLDGSNGFTINGISESSNLGWAVSALGDINNDGIDDIIVTASNANESKGQAYVIYGSKDPFGSSFDLSSLNSDNGFVIDGLATDGQFGYSVRGTGDINDDGVNDFIIGAPFANSNNGAAYVVFGTSVNKAPTDLSLSNSTIDENVGANFVVGSLSTSDPNGNDTFTYSIVPNQGDFDAFDIIDGNKLIIKNSPDYETKNSYTIQVETKDQGGLSYKKDLTITINDLNETTANQGPTELKLDKDSIDENVDPHSVVGSFITIDPDQNDGFQYSFVDGEDDDNSAFTIAENQLLIKDSPDFETKNSYKIRVKTQDASGASLTQILTININDVNENPVVPPVLTPLLTHVGNGVFNINGPSDKTTLQVQLTGRNSSRVNQLGVYTVDDANGNIGGTAPGTEGYAAKALANSQVIFSAVTNPPAGFNISSIERLLAFNSNKNLGFFLITDGSIDSVQNGSTPISNILFSNPSTVKITDLGSNSFSLDWEDGTGVVNGFENLQIKIQATDKPITLGTGLQSRPEGEALDIRNFTGTINAEFIVNREANFNNFVGFYRATDVNGGIDTNGDGIADLTPGQAGYVEAAVRNRLPDIGLTTNNGATTTLKTTLQGGGIYLPFLIVDGRPDSLLDSNPNNNPNIYFTFLGANADKVDHVRIFGDNIFGFEDLPGGGDKDFNDVIVRINLTAA
ncbi:MAG: DUF4114 domain-containing protein [Cuspidothrix sp.]